MLKLLFLLLWKNCLIVKHAFCLFLVCIVCEIAWFVLIHRDVWKQDEAVSHPRIPLILESISERPIHIFYSPSTNFTDALLKGVAKGVTEKGVVQTHSYENFQRMFYAIYNLPMTGYVVGINFTHPEIFSDELPKTLSYEIWEVFDLSITHHLNNRTVRLREELSNCKRIICIQGAIDKSFIDEAVKYNKYRFFATSVPISMTNTCLQDILDDIKFTLIPQNAALSLITFLIVIFVSRERAEGGQKLMIIVGIPSWTNWISWLITSYIIELIPCMVISIVLYLIYYNTNTTLTIIYLLVSMYCLASKCAYFFVVTLISQQDFAKLACFVLWLLSHWPLFLRQKTFTFKLLTSFIPQMAVIWGYVELEEMDVGTCSGKIRNVENWSLSTAIICLVADSIIYIFLAWIIDVYFNGCFGREFPIRQSQKQSLQTVDVAKSSVVEEPVVIAIKGLIHRYKRHYWGDILTRHVLTDINMDILKNEVIFILGSDEDGMTTLISAIIGCVNPTSGSVTVNGINPRYFWNIGRYVGICLEKPLFFPNLSAKENLMFFSIFRGRSIKQATAEADTIMQKLKLKDTGYKQSKTMRKKMCIGMALIGAPPILVLDEPTAGLGADPRKDIWKAIDLVSQKHTVIITTNNKNEADNLADKIALIYQGRIQAYGTNLWLKRQFGSGYDLTLKIENENNAEAVSKVVQKFVPEASVVNSYDMLLTYSIPFERRNDIFAIINAIENESELGILNVYVDLKSLDEIYKKFSSPPTLSLYNYSIGNIRLQDKLCEKQEIIINQINALIWKKFLYTYRFVAKWKFLGLTTFLAHVGGFILFSEVIHSFDKEEFTIMRYRHITGGYLIKGNVPQSLIESYETALTIITEVFEQVFKFTDMFDTPIGAEMIENNGILEMNALYGPWVGDICWKSVNVVTNAALHSIDPQFNIIMEKRVFDIFLIHNKIIEALFFSCFGFVVILAYFPLLPMVEIQNKTKRMQWLAGITDAMYWSVCLCMDMILYVIFSCAVVGIIAYVNANVELFDLVAVLLLFFIFGLCAIPITYIHVFIFNSYLHVITCILVQYTICLIIHLSFIDYENILAMKILEFYPVFGLISAVFKLYMQMSENMCVRIKEKIDCSTKNEPCCSFPCTGNNCYTVKSYFSFTSNENPHGIGDALLSFSIGTVLVTILVVILDFNMFQALFHKIIRKVYFKGNRKTLEEDSELMVEKELSHALSGKKYNNKYLLAVDNVTKIYRKGKYSVKYYAAVDSLSMTIKRGDFFALVGCNDAGKTVLINMIVGDEFPSFGRLRLFASSIGYCPQDVQLFSHLTAHENLIFFAAIRGLSTNSQFCEVDSMLKYFGLWESRNKFVSDLSKTQMSKLGAAAAMIGDPDFIIMDLSSTGLDPVIRQQIWGTIRQIQKPWQGILATSDILEHTEGSYNRLAAMLNGKFLSAESWKKLQEKIDGLVLKIYVNMSPYNKERNNLLIEAIETNFKDQLELMLQKRDFLLYNVADKAVKVSSLVNGIMELSKHFVEIEDFSIQKSCIYYEIFS